MGNKLRRIFCPTEEERLEDRKQYLALHEKMKVKKDVLLVSIAYT